jgi:LysM repeat protein
MSRLHACLQRCGVWLLALAMLGAPVAGAAQSAQAQAGQVIHIVQPGENLFRIGLRYGISWTVIVAANNLPSTYIYVGQRLIIPVSGDSVPPAPAPAATAQPPAPPPAADGTYVVQYGDTLSGIAVRFGVPFEALAAANSLGWPWVIYAGQTLVIPGAGVAVTGRQLSVWGQDQAYTLDCEARSAADWAGYFGTTISEWDFINRLPVSDDPDVGFVGSIYGARGQLPPADYGVHAGPVAALLRAYGLNAQARGGLAWDVLRGEIDAGRPAIVWVIGQIWDGTPIAYQAPSTGRVTTVAAYEHTVIISGYSAGPGWEQVTVLDGGHSYDVSLTQFLRSWSVLGYMAVTGSN